ncbi:MAG: HPr family phosphocarrier protein [Anaerolineaceae bacterium]|nr:HPr family phosphocarrier protein [Anaerolineaceae bacterium]
MPEIQLEITNEVGLHARPAALFVQAASQFESEITVSLDDSEADAKSILDILLLGANKGSIITVKAEGPDADEALEAFKELHANNFGEKE